MNIPADKYSTLHLLHEHITEVRMRLDELYSILPMDDYYRLRQLLEEAMAILKRY
ncbi:MAG: hypothetical protein KGH61_05555 [Candidatus Micrarchaeota archaeon]|nr:hypothetical protein [Candidatus Micrarchaeota archaeon]MDE1824950.1 hypothetical protein [Candidatus Micrarchaeota archaeon]MDE1825498.1 hypothetical protein [Candidatus Micrarchaeota archaeon]MDE1847607.1 hypothetical protein [Candidatus Micrarchaeota archaeon]MDE1848380.1 hypothetical protein [Candidatus Micrarchaeota archaeon]